MKRKLLLAARIDRRRWRCSRCPRPPLRKAPPSPTSRSAKQIADTVCAACHGADGNSAAPANPNLAGQGAEYITRQLQHFKSGIRANPMMSAMVAKPDAGRHGRAWESTFRSRSRRAARRRIRRSSRPGSRCFAAGWRPPGLPACASCHSPNGAGIPKNYPRLAGQHADYALCATEGVQGRRARRGQGRQGRARQDHGGDRAEDDRRADEGGGRLHRRIALAARCRRRLLQLGAHDRLFRTIAFGNPHRRLGAHLVANHDFRRVAMIDRGLVEEPPQRPRPGRAGAGRDSGSRM